MAKLTFHGAAGQVTGSSHIVQANGRTILLDCGLFQGRRQHSWELNHHHAVPPQTVHAVVVSHAHIDHTGRLPLLVRDGFGGVIHTTPATRDLCALMLVDSAHIQQEDARWLNKKRKGDDVPDVAPMYTEDDAVQAVQQMQSSPIGRWFKVAGGMHARYFNAGHMLGSAGIELEINEEGGRRIRLVFTGDVGRRGTPIIRDPAPLPACDYLICESTYGGRVHEPYEDVRSQLRDVIRRTVERGGRVLIPAFSVGRTQTVVYYLSELFARGELKPLPVFIDSPLAINATEVFRLHPECYDRQAKELAAGHGAMLDGPGIRYVRTREESKKITRRRGPCVVISASGMCEAGRILHHLSHAITQPRNTVLLVGFQAMHTLGRRIAEREPYVTIYRQKLKLQAEVVALNGFSSHADSGELEAHVAPVRAECKQAFLVHGEPDQSSALAERLRKGSWRQVLTPSAGDSFELS